MINWFTKKKVKPIHVCPRDTITLTYTNPQGRSERIVHEIGKTASYDTMAVGEIENELGMKDGIVGVIGNEE
jgi:hypothetical protein